METKPVEVLKDKYKDANCAIIGSGRSIRLLNFFHFTDINCIIALNAAAPIIEKLFPAYRIGIYSMQKDGVASNCPPISSTTNLLVSEHESKDFCPDHPNRYIFNAEILCPSPFGYQEFSANCALMFAKLLGCSFIRLYGFDACTTQDYFNIEGYSLESNYAEQCIRMRELIEREQLNVEWV